MLAISRSLVGDTGTDGAGFAIGLDRGNEVDVGRTNPVGVAFVFREGFVEGVLALFVGLGMLVLCDEGRQELEFSAALLFDVFAVLTGVFAFIQTFVVLWIVECGYDDQAATGNFCYDLRFDAVLF
jgi:hypothetical protein